ncbi:MAG: hypothetical protein IPI60_07885 [Saprospiraceae bacterium]|nr:hypothetical protein [Saprospiraceae bacterium]
MRNKKPYNSQLNSDEHIRETFQDYRAPYDSDSWDLLSEKLDKALPFVSLNDSEIKEDLATISMPYNSASWDVLEQRLDLFDTRRKWIFRGKIVELTMFFFVFFFMSDSFNEPFELYQKETEIASDDSKTSKQSDAAESKQDQNVNEASILKSSSQNTADYILKKTSELKVPGQLPLAGKNDSELVHANNSNSALLRTPELINQESLPVSKIESDSDGTTPWVENQSKASSSSDLHAIYGDNKLNKE